MRATVSSSEEGQTGDGQAQPEPLPVGMTDPGHLSPFQVPLNSLVCSRALCPWAPEALVLCTRAVFGPPEVLQPGVPCLAIASSASQLHRAWPPSEGLTAAGTLVAPAQSSHCSTIDGASMSCGSLRSPPGLSRG